MPLEADGCLFWVGLWVFGETFIDGGSVEILVVVDDDAVVDDGDKCWAHQFAFGIFWSGKNDVITLPFSLCSGGIHHWGSLPVEGSGLAVGVGDIGMAFLDLDFVFIHEEDAAVAAFLVFYFAASWNLPLDVELAIAKALFGVVVTG